jgi:nitroimidazol reductase NimA-like FMN-containing flavoprotein (pyridoxamine 5'-phosphate oxidase superfamily)
MIVCEMTRDDCIDILTRSHLGRLACAQDGQPYITPFCFVFEDPFLYALATRGQKIDWMRANPQVCVELDHVEACDRWHSIVIFGHYEELPPAPDWKHELIRAHALLKTHVGWWEAGWASREQLFPGQDFDYVFYRIHIDRMTGRRASAELPARGKVPGAGPPPRRWPYLRGLARRMHIGPMCDKGQDSDR